MKYVTERPHEIEKRHTNEPSENERKINETKNKAEETFTLPFSFDQFVQFFLFFQRTFHARKHILSKTKSNIDVVPEIMLKTSARCEAKSNQKWRG